MDPQRLAYWLLKDVNRAIRDYALIQDGDRVAVAVSGGKDSLGLLRLLDWRRRFVPESYDLVAIHVVGDSRGPDLPVHAPLVTWLEAEGYPTRVVPMQLPGTESLPLGCQRCTHHRRHTLFEAAHQLGCNLVAFGHHADDLAQTSLLNLLFHGRVETMTPRREYFDGLLRLIRPLCYLSEKELRRFARANAFPAPPPVCPQSLRSSRRAAAQLLNEAGRLCPAARVNLVRAGLEGNARAGEENKRSGETIPSAPYDSRSGKS